MKLAAFDIGSNTVLMVAVEVGANAKPRVLAERSRITRLGRGVDSAGRLDPDSAARTLAAIEEFAAEARSLGADKIVAAATAALRDAADGSEFIGRVEQRTGIALEIIPGLEEARLSHLAVVRGLSIDPDARLLILDIGGGSTEFIRAEPGHELQMKSLQIGSVRLTERCVRGDPPSAADVAALRSTIDSALVSLGWDFHPDVTVGIAGTVTTICAVLMGMTSYDAGAVHGRVLARAEIERAIAMFGSRTLAERRKLPGLVEGRADVIFAGAAILERAMARFGAKSVIVSDQGVRWGLVWREIDRQASR